MAKIAVVSMVKNEADIIESFVRHALTFADVLLVADHQSTDGTRDILQALEAEGLPIRIELLAMVEQAQSEVVTALMRRAVSEEAADLVLPLDADEFLLPDAEAADVHLVLQALPLDRVYSLAWVRYALDAPTQAADAFLLRRPCHREAQVEPLRKVLVGREAARQTQLRISQGSHVAVIAGAAGPLALEAEPVVGVHLAHFPWRSEAQAASKAACGWLANVAKYSRYTDIANHWRRDFTALLSGESLPALPLKAPVAASIPASCREVTLQYTKAAVGALANVLRFGETLADAYAAQQVLQRQQQVSLLLPCFGDGAELSERLQNVLQQTYPYRKIFVLAMDGADFACLSSLIKPLAGVTVLDGTADIAAMFARLAKAASGAYVQWVFPGDRLQPDKVQRMLVSLERQPELTFVLSNAASLPAVPEPLRVEGDLPLDGEFFIKGNGLELWQYLLRSGILPSGGIASVLFRRETMERTGWLQSAFAGGRPLYLSMWGQVLPQAIVGVFGEVTLRSSGTVRTADDFIWQQLEWFCLLEEQGKAGSGALSPTYREGKRVFRARASVAAAFQDQVTPRLYAQYQAIL